VKAKRFNLEQGHLAAKAETPNTGTRSKQARHYGKDAKAAMCNHLPLA
jgi:hypothetical protein